MTKYKQIIALSIVGYVCVLAIRYAEGILTSLTNIIGMITNVNPKIYVFLDIVPEILIITFWVLVIFKFLKGFKWDEHFNDTNLKKFGMRLGITVLVLFLILLGARYFENELYGNKTDYYGLDKDLMLINYFVLNGLNLIEVVIVVIGFIKLINRKVTDVDIRS